MNDAKPRILQPQLFDDRRVGVQHLVDRTVADGMRLQLPACRGRKQVGLLHVGWCPAEDAEVAWFSNYSGWINGNGTRAHAAVGKHFRGAEFQHVVAKASMHAHLGQFLSVCDAANPGRHLDTHLEPAPTVCLLVPAHLVGPEEDVMDGGEANLCRFFGNEPGSSYVNVRWISGEDPSDEPHRRVLEDSGGFSRRVVLNHSTLRILGGLGEVGEFESGAVGHAHVTAHVLQINGTAR